MRLAGRTAPLWRWRNPGPNCAVFVVGTERSPTHTPRPEVDLGEDRRLSARVSYDGLDSVF
jgi:hypothetical protein